MCPQQQTLLKKTKSKSVLRHDNYWIKFVIFFYPLIFHLMTVKLQPFSPKINRPFPSFDFHLSNQNVKRETFCHFILHLGNRHHINGTHIPGTLRQTTLNKCQKKEKGKEEKGKGKLRRILERKHNINI